MLETFQKANNCKITRIFEPRRVEDVASTYADISLAKKKVLGCSPKKYLFDICKDGWKWSEMNPDGYK